jgi:hypothetical protein
MVIPLDEKKKPAVRLKKRKKAPIDLKNESLKWFKINL